MMEAATAEVARSISMAADAAKETSRTSSEVHEAASSMSGLVGRLKEEVASVVVGLRG